jgi:hypothetical protein
MFFGWSAILSAVATLGTLITGILFFTVDEKFGRTNDILSVVQVLLMLPVAMAMYRLTHSAASIQALSGTVMGGIGMIVTAVLQVLLVLRVVSFEQTIATVLTAGAVIGVWLVWSNALASRAGALPWGLAVFGIVAGAGYIMICGGFFLGRQQHPLFYAGSGLAVVGYVVWATWIWRLLRTSSISTYV